LRFHFPIIVFDLETDGDPATQAITEVGAVALDHELNPAPEEFQSYVLPDFPVTDKSLAITGHSLMVLEKAPPWMVVANKFEWWVKTAACENLKKPRLAAWGNYFDVAVIRRQYERHNIPFPFSGTCIDVKTVAITWAALSGRRTDEMSVQKCCEMMRLEPVGKYHNALVDAVMTARILRRALAEMAGGVWVDKKYIRVGGGE
jgi:DNA polymerase III epsilon subunit-like protein